MNNKTLYIRAGMILCLLIVGASFAFSQTKKIPAAQPFALLFPPQPEQDCIHAIPLCNNSYVQQNSYSGQGAILNEINPLYSCLTSGERNDVWYSFTVKTGGDLNFSITPINPSDDYDWAVFNLTGKSCSNIALDSTMEVSCNFSANTGCGGVTGPNGLTSGFCGQQNEPIIPVIAGETYVINVSNFSASQSGYSIDFSLSTAIIYDIVPPKGIPITVGCTKNNLAIDFNEMLDCNSLSDPVTEFKLVDATGFDYAIQTILTPGCNNNTSTGQLTFNLYGPLAKTATTYLVSINGNDGNTFSDICGNFVPVNDTIAVINVMNDAVVNLGMDVNICPDVNKPVLDAQNPDAAIYQWSFNGAILPVSTQMLQTVNAGIYSIEVLYGAGCFAKDTMQLSFLPVPVVNLGNDITVCKEANLPLLNAGNSGAQYSWFHNGNYLGYFQQTYQPTQPGIFSVTVNGTFCPAEDSLTINFFPETIIQLGSDQFLCDGDSLIINATLPGVQTYNWLFSNNYFSNQPVITVMNTGKYVLMIIDSSQCEAKDSIYVKDVMTPGMPHVHCPVDYGTYLEYNWNGAADAEGYEISEDGGLTWSTPSSGANGLSHQTNSLITEIKVRAISIGNCKPGAASVSEHCDIHIANVVTPNNDGKNDSFIIENIDQHPNTTLTILNRYGAPVFKSPDYRNDWIPDQLPSGTYYYIVSFPDSRSFKGTLTILK